MALGFRHLGTWALAIGVASLGCSDGVALGDAFPPAAGATSVAGTAGLASGGSGGAGGSGAGTGMTAGSSAGPSSGSCAPSTVVLAEDGIRNARDLGGIPLAGGRTVKCGVLFRGPPLDLKTEDGCDHYRQLGVRVLVDLRQPEERGGRPDAACTMEGATVLPAPLPIPYQVSPQNYVADLNTLDSMALIFHALGTADGYPMYFHCTFGRDRTAIVAAVILTALGASREAIMDDYMISQSTVGAYPDSLTATLDELDRKGGVEGYYAELGVTAEELAFLREYATEP